MMDRDVVHVGVQSMHADHVFLSRDLSSIQPLLITQKCMLRESILQRFMIKSYHKRLVLHQKIVPLQK